MTRMLQVTIPCLFIPPDIELQPPPPISERKYIFFLIPWLLHLIIISFGSKQQRTAIEDQFCVRLYTTYIAKLLAPPSPLHLFTHPQTMKMLNNRFSQR